ncbi:formyltetrahydrofolate deformylase [Salinisphaera sp. LB1]|uniref:formyltetrahydrofolate deformylase n=1 Tax=Salinisphaera sp. LB1 TaxID=2183911 RepID=UPI000D7081D2|nr:formyltetrahydrofolate deformylase [Salinisphaera sp. LB1]AWN16839.1 Formyltetrahydrofolate deformylase [Salinisphaera sp. LB1]
MSRSRFYTLRFSCPDSTGIVARVATFIAEHGGWILRSSQHSDEESGRFFMRVEVRADSLPFQLDALQQRFAPLAREMDMDWQISDSAVRKRVVILVSRQMHCLYDLLERWQSGELDIDIPCVISNHEDARGLTEWHGIPFHHVAIDKSDKAAGFAEIERLFEEAEGEVMVLARFMQILPTALCERLRGRVLNIHHSFLPSFVGAAPYLQAYRRGVKQVGATCHYVTASLDEGPIIDQDVTRVDHTDSVRDLIRYGKDIEKAVLARGLRHHLEDRVMISGNRTIVL